MRTIGVIGCYSHDVILLLAKAVRCLGERVIVRDRNDARILSACIPLSEENNREGYTEYHGIYFSAGEGKTGTDDGTGVEFVDFGLSPRPQECGLCKELIVICDMHMHHMRWIRDAVFPRENVKLCILRDVVPGLLSREKTVTDFLTGLNAERQIYLLPDDRDIKNRYVCELQHAYSLKNASDGMREAIFETVCLLFPDTEEKELRRKLRQEERREYR